VTAAVQHTATAARLREEADLLDLIAGVVFGAVSLLDAASSLNAVAGAKRSAAELLDEMAREQAYEPPLTCTCGRDLPCPDTT
jgi:hypothetical protein